MKQFKDLLEKQKDMHVPQLTEDEENELVGARAARLNVLFLWPF
ncbi:MAG TPA: hypothetical protein VK541_08515 [Pedobacter sp.]|nr:hypothetical protein [Pedobacter sp.]HMI02509.1 hypothetical protein [Pedobacter sp.]